MAADDFTAIVTGANSGLGFAIACRLITEFLETRPPSESLVLIITTRSTHKSNVTLSRLRLHIDQTVSRNKRGDSVRELSQHSARIKLQSEIVDLTSIISVQQLAQRLLASASRIDAIILNAGIGGWVGMQWLHASWAVPTDWVQATTWPPFKVSGKGWTTKPQESSPTDGTISSDTAGKDVSIGENGESALGEVFCANVFGHYLLVHYIIPLLSSRSVDGSCGKIIWVSSIEAHAQSLDLEDIQALKSNEAYESSKRVTDILALTYGTPATEPWVSHFVSTSKDATEQAGTSRPKMYVTQPGVCSTGIFPLPYVVGLLMVFAFYVSRWLGSPWHTCDPYLGATSAVWVALAPQSLLDSAEEREGLGKWGSATDRLGRERVARTEVEGWGWGGVVGESKRKGRKRGARDLTEEQREGFVELGRHIWRSMEELREQWEARLPAARFGLRS
ncbi:MAG: 3-keto-steroid reductase [Bathelium mastoideum]|nr:MAG: 3-keto-steroid reductase [Bathelium mastoideum]KAI9686489.1 MAG: 3-keto-steroid reductase [Bathelium mastoideum]